MKLNCAGLYTTAAADVIQFVMRPLYWSASTQGLEPRKSQRSQSAIYLMKTVLFADLNNHVCVSNIDGVHYDPEAMEPIATLMFECVRKLGF